MNDSAKSLADAIFNVNIREDYVGQPSTGSRWLELSVGDLTHWSECGILNQDSVDHFRLAGDVCRLYKDVFGVNPVNMDLNSMSIDKLEDLLSDLSDQLEAKRFAQEQQGMDVDSFASASRDVVEEFLKPAPSVKIGDLI